MWAQKWKVTFNGDKSKEMIFSKRDQQNSPPITFCTHIVENVSVHRHLGVYLTPTLNWSTYGEFHPGRELTAIELENFWFAVKPISMWIYFKGFCTFVYMSFF